MMRKLFLISLIAFGLVFSIGFSSQPVNDLIKVQDLGEFHK
ncbi:hypothetical protein [Bacillus suaedae]|nr:hypothetical protein [Bacillus suaedae]